MSLQITIVKSPQGASLTEASKVFDQSGGTIGRGSDNFWKLDDPERFLSSRHTQISHENGQYALTDLSLNGTFMNGASEPLGKGNKVVIKDGDVFDLGDYQFKISISAAKQPDAPFDMGTPASSPFGDVPSFDSPAPVADFASPFGAPQPSATDPLLSPGSVETDPLAALDKAQQSGLAPQPPRADIFAAKTHSDGADPMNQAFNMPDSIQEKGAIPDDWDLDEAQQAAPHRSLPLTEPPVAPPVSPSPVVEEPPKHTRSHRETALEHENLKLQVELERLKKQMSEAPSVNATSGGGQSDRTLLEAMGLTNHDLDEQQVAEINRIVGRLIRETVSGMMQLLSSRSSIRNQFRMHVTTIQPVENNPLKFSANVDDALENMFVKKGNAYKGPIEAICEGFDGITEHQMATLAGMRAGFNGVIERFEPSMLEKRFEKNAKTALIPGMQKLKHWESYAGYYKDLVDDLDDSFEFLFGQEFVQAYEDQLQKLTIARKKKRS